MKQRTVILMILALAGVVCTLAMPLLAQDGGMGSNGQLNLTPDEQAWLKAHPEVRLGAYPNYPPAQWIDEDGEHKGVAADYCERIEELLGITFVNVYSNTWIELLVKTKARQIDVIALVAETDDRKDYLLFTEPYLTLPAVIIARDTVEGQLTLDDLKGMRVGVVNKYASHIFLRDNYPDLIIDPSPDTQAGLRKVSFGMTDVFVSDLAVASYYIENEGISNLTVVGESGFVYEMGSATRNDWPELHSAIEKALAQITPGERAAIYSRWIGLSEDGGLSPRTLAILAVVLAALGLFVAGFIIWNRSLQRLVLQKTEALRHSEGRVRSIIANALDAVVTMDAEGNVSGWSKQAEVIFGWPRDEVLGRTLAELIIPTAYREAHVEGLQRFLDTGKGSVLNTRIEITATRRDGAEFPVELTIAAIQAGDSYEFSAFVRDITERKRSEAEIEQHRNNLEGLVVERTAEMRHAKDVAERARAELSERVTELEDALSEIKQLRGLLPICSYCKRIREGEDYSQSVEAYLSQHTDAQFSHGVCPDCYEKHVKPQLEEL